MVSILFNTLNNGSGFIPVQVALCKIEKCKNVYLVLIPLFNFLPQISALTLQLQTVTREF